MLLCRTLYKLRLPTKVFVPSKLYRPTLKPLKPLLKAALYNGSWGWVDTHCEAVVSVWGASGFILDILVQRTISISSIFFFSLKCQSGRWVLGIARHFRERSVVQWNRLGLNDGYSHDFCLHRIKADKEGEVNGNWLALCCCITLHGIYLYLVAQWNGLTVLWWPLVNIHSDTVGPHKVLQRHTT